MRLKLSSLDKRLLYAAALLVALACFSFAAHAQLRIVVEPAHREISPPPNPADFPQALPNGVLELVDNGEAPFHSDGSWDWLDSSLSIDVNPATDQPAIAYFAYVAPPGYIQTAFFTQRNPDGSWSAPSKISYPPREPPKASVGIELDMMFDPSDYVAGVGESAVPYIAANVYNRDLWDEYYANTGLNLYKGLWDAASGSIVWTALRIVQSHTYHVWVPNFEFDDEKDENSDENGLKELGRWELVEENPYFIYTQPKLIVGNDPRMPEGQRQVQAVYYQSSRLLGPFMKYDPYASEWVEDSQSEKRIMSLAEATFTSQRGPFTIDVESGFDRGFGAYDFRPLRGGEASYRNAVLYIESSYGRETLYYKVEQEGGRAWNYPRDEVTSLAGFNQRFGSISLDCIGDKAGILWTVHPELDYTSDVYFLENVGEAWRPSLAQPVASGVSWTAKLAYAGDSTPVVLYREAEEPYRLYIKCRRADGVWSEPILADEENPERTTDSFEMAIRGDKVFIASGKDGDLYCTTLDLAAIVRGE